MGELSHVDDQGAARMVDVSAKPVTDGWPPPRGRVVLAPEALELLRGAACPRATRWPWPGWPASWAPSAPPT